MWNLQRGPSVIKSCLLQFFDYFVFVSKYKDFISVIALIASMLSHSKMKIRDCLTTGTSQSTLQRGFIIYLMIIITVR